MDAETERKTGANGASGADTDCETATVPNEGADCGAGVVPDEGAGCETGAAPDEGADCGAGVVPDEGAGCGAGAVPDEGAGCETSAESGADTNCETGAVPDDIAIEAGGEAKPLGQRVLLTLLYFVCPPLWAAAFFGMPIYKRLFKNRATSLFNCYILPPAAVMTVFLAIYDKCGIYPFGKKTIAWCDMTQEGVPYWLNFKHIIQGKDDLFLNMANAAGMDGFSFLRSFFVYPFSYLILLVSDGDGMLFVSLTTALKFAMCSVTAMIFFRTALKKLHPSFAVALSLMYSFCAYGAMYCQLINWPDSMYIMPLYFTGLYLLIKRHKILPYTVALSLVMLNISFAFMTVIATLLFVGCYFLVCGDREQIKRTAHDFAFGSVFAALLTTPLWLPFFGAFSTSARGVSIGEALKNSAHFSPAYTVYPLVMSTAFMFVCAAVFMAVKKGALRKALYFLFGMMLIPLVIEPVNKIWHFGSYTCFPARYAYILIFAGLVLAGALLSEDGRGGTEVSASVSGAFVRPPRLTTALFNFFSAAFVFCVCFGVYKYVRSYAAENSKEMSRYATTLWGNEKSYKHILVLFLLFLFLYALFYVIYRKKLLPKRVFAFALVSLALCEAYVSINTYMTYPSYKMNADNYAAYEDLAGRIDDADGFYRVKNRSFLNAAYGDVSEANFPGALGYPSMGHYSSLTSESYLYAAKAYGYSSVWMKVDSFGGTKFSDALFSIRYGIDKAEKKPDNAVCANDKYCVAKNDFCLPLGIFAEGGGADLDLEEYTRIELQERVFKAVTRCDKDLFAELKPFECHGCRLEKSGGAYRITKSSKGSAYMEYKVKIDGRKTLYFDCFDKFSNALSEKINGSFSVYVNGKKLQTKYPVDKQNGILDLGTYEDSEVSVKIDVLKNVSCRSFGLYLMDDVLLEARLKNVGAAGLKVSGNKIRGTYKAESDGRLFVSVTHNPGFKCKVNGRSVELGKCFGGFIAVPVKAGENEICVSYFPPLLAPALAVCALTVAAAVALALIFRRRGCRFAYDATRAAVGDRAANALSGAAAVCVLLAFAAVLFFIYAYPIVLNF